MNTDITASRVLVLAWLVVGFELAISQKWQRQVCPIVPKYQSSAECPLGSNKACSSDEECARASPPGISQRCCPTACGVKCTTPKPAVGCPIPIDLGLVLDSSGSIGRKNWKKVQDFAKSVVNSYDVSERGTHIGLITYSSNTSLDIAFNKFTGVELNAVNLKRDIDGIALQGGLTYMDKALEQANNELFRVENGMRPDKQQVCLFLTDGIQTVDNTSTSPTEVSKKLKGRGIEVYTLGIGSDVDVLQLIEMSSGDGYVFSAKGFDELKQQVKGILEKQCKGCDKTLDIVFGIPNSQSLGGESANVKQVMSKLAGLFKVSNTGAHIGVVAYNQNAHLALPLDEAYTVEGVQRIIAGLPGSPKHGFNTAAAMRVAADHAFTLYGGVRQTQPKVFVMLAPRESTSSAAEIKAAAEKLKKNGVRVMVVGVGGSANPATYSSAVTQPSKRFLMNTLNYDDLNAAVYEIADTVCQADYGKCPVPGAGIGGAQCEVDKDCPGEDQLCCVDGAGGTSCTTGFKNCFVPFEMVIAIDNSETVVRQDFEQMKTFVRDLMWPYTNSENNIHFGVMTFAGSTQKITNGFRKFRSEQDLNNMIASIQKTQDPQRRVDITFQAASRDFFSMEGGTRHGHGRYLLVLSSDQTSPGTGDLKVAAKDLDLLNVQRIAVATNSDVPPTFLRDVASDPNLVFQAKDAAELPQTAKRIQTILCTEKDGSCPAVKPIDPGSCRGLDTNRIPCGRSDNRPRQSQKENDWDCPGEQKCCRSDNGCHNYCTDPPLVCDKHKDILVMFENSDEIGDKRAFGLEKEMVSRLIGAFDVSPQNTHVAVASFSGSARSVIRFNGAAATNKQLAEARIQKVTFQGGSFGSTSAALEAANKNFFDLRAGMRPAVNKSLVIIGSGYIQDPEKARAMAQELRSKLVDIFAVTIGDNANYPVLRDVVSREVAKNVFAVSTGDALAVQIRALVKAVCEGAKKELIVSIPVDKCTFQNLYSQLPLKLTLSGVQYKFNSIEGQELVRNNEVSIIAESLLIARCP